MKRATILHLAGKLEQTLMAPGTRQQPSHSLVLRLSVVAVAQIAGPAENPRFDKGKRMPPESISERR